MDHLALILIILLILSHIISISLGIGLGYLLFRNRSQDNLATPSSFFNSKHVDNNVKDCKKPKLDIDETKIVLNVSTDGMEKKFDNMTQEIKTQNDTVNSVNKLKQMKGK
jgi:hypothetical protein